MPHNPPPKRWSEAESDFEVIVMNTEQLEAELTRLRNKCTELHRRCQKAEAAVLKFKRQWDANGGPCGGNFGRALLASACDALEDENRILRRGMTGDYDLDAWLDFVGQKECS